MLFKVSEEEAVSQRGPRPTQPPRLSATTWWTMFDPQETGHLTTLGDAERQETQELSTLVTVTEETTAAAAYQHQHDCVCFCVFLG